MKLYLIRHGETVWNTEKRFQGAMDSPLTELGIRQAKKLGERLKNTHFNAFYSSPAGRAMSTARLVISDRNIKAIPLDEFKEISVGIMEGKKREDFISKYPKEFNDLFTNPKEYDPKAIGGESYYELVDRVKLGLDKLVKSHKDTDTIALITHGVTFKAMLLLMKNLTFEQVQEIEIPENTSLTIVDYTDSKYEIEVFSDTKHLGEDEKSNIYSKKNITK